VSAPLALLLAIALVPAVLADDRDPRCADWERHGVPPGVQVDVLCPADGIRLADVPLSDEPLVPYIVGLLVMAVVLTAFGFVSMRYLAKRSRPVRETDLWTCGACRTANRPDRASCFSCQASRGTPASVAASGGAPPA